jgi:acetylornithine deacetylase/succinyl-diaminopimelate desuccinylase-like protein
MTQNILRTVADSQSWAINTLKAYASIPSISAQKKAIPETVRFLQKTFAACGLKTRLINAGGNPFVYAEKIVSAKAPTIIFYNHYDVQPPDPLDEWLSPPFTPTLRNGRLYGRGISDNKGNLIARLTAVRALKASGFTAPCNIKFIIDGEEEIGSPSMGRLVQKYQKQLAADLCIWESGSRSLDGRPEISLGYKGVLCVELFVQGPNIDMHSSQGIVIPNPAWRLVWALGCLKNEYEKIMIDGFYKGCVKPSLSDKKVGEAYPLHEKESLRKLGLKNYVLGLSGKRLRDHYFYDPALNINGLTSGYQGKGHKTVLPARASAKIDFRLIPGQKPADVLKKLRRYLDKKGFKDIKLSSEGGYVPVQTPVTHPYVKLITRSVEAVYKKPHCVEPISPASSPMSFFAGFVSCVAIGIGHPDEKIHAPNENIYLKDLLLGSQAIAQILMDFGKKA